MTLLFVIIVNKDIFYHKIKQLVLKVEVFFVINLKVMVILNVKLTLMVVLPIPINNMIPVADFKFQQLFVFLNHSLLLASLFMTFSHVQSIWLIHIHLLLNLNINLRLKCNYLLELLFLIQYLSIMVLKVLVFQFLLQYHHNLFYHLVVEVI